MSAVHPLWRNIDYKEMAVYFVRVGRLFLIFQIQNCNYQKTNGQDDHEFFICTHKHHPFLQDDRMGGARPLAAQVNILLVNVL